MIIYSSFVNDGWLFDTVGVMVEYALKDKEIYGYDYEVDCDYLLDIEDAIREEVWNMVKPHLKVLFSRELVWKNLSTGEYYLTTSNEEVWDDVIQGDANDFQGGSPSFCFYEIEGQFVIEVANDWERNENDTLWKARVLTKDGLIKYFKEREQMDAEGKEESSLWEELYTSKEYSRNLNYFSTYFDDVDYDLTKYQVRNFD